MIIIMIKIMSIVSIIIQSQAAFVSCLHLLTHPTFQSFLLCRLTRTRITRIPR